MASLRKQSKGNSWQLRVTVKGKSIALSLRDLAEDQAKKWQLCVQAIADAIDLGLSRDRVVSEWLSSLDRDQRKKLSDKGLIEADDPVEEKPDPLLSDFLRENFESRATDVKGSTSTFYRHTRKRLEEYFKGRTVKSITPGDAKKFRLWLQTTNKRDKPKDGEASKGLSINTVRRRTGVCRQIFSQAIADLSPGIAAKLSPEGGKKLAQKLAHGVGLKGLGASLDDSTVDRPRMRKTQEILGFDAICRLLARDGFPLIMGDEGLERSSKTRGNWRF